MMLIKKVYRHAKEAIWSRAHTRLCKKYRARFHNQDVSIISMNCIGGILYHDLGIQFQSPTINLFMRAKDYIKFCENLEHYLSIDKLIECCDPQIVEDRDYPIAWLGSEGDILLYLVHYRTVAEAEKKWKERNKRINWNNIVIICTDREGMTEELKDRFEGLPYNKVMFTNRPDAHHNSCFYIKGYEEEESVGIVTEHKGFKGYRPIDQYDWVVFLNNEM